MYENVVSALRTCVDKEKDCSDCPYNQKCMNNTSGKHAVMVDAADAIEKLIEVIQNHDFLESLTKPRWIPVTERMPEDGSDVLAYLDSRITAANYYKETWQDCVMGRLYLTEEGVVTHWMPLPQAPEPPKEEA